MNDIESLAQEYRHLLATLDVGDAYKSFHTTPQHDGSPHVEFKDGMFHYLVTERGTELERITNLSAPDVLYLLFQGVTFTMATQYELKNRVDGIDGRTIWFPYQEDLMRKLSPEWGDRLKAKHQRILKDHPFRS